jgi:tetratricopeptide (TPR) repeat protein
LLQTKIKNKIYQKEENENENDSHLDSLLDLALFETYLDEQQALQTIEEIKKTYLNSEELNLKIANLYRRLGEIMMKFKEKKDESIEFLNKSLTSYEKLVDSQLYSSRKMEIFQSITLVLNNLATIMMERENHTQTGKKYFSSFLFF